MRAEQNVIEINIARRRGGEEEEEAKVQKTMRGENDEVGVRGGIS